MGSQKGWRGQKVVGESQFAGPHKLPELIAYWVVNENEGNVSSHERRQEKNMGGSTHDMLVSISVNCQHTV